MRLVTTRQAGHLTGLSTEQLREWTDRRALVPADVQRRGRGSPAQYTWQTVLLIRIAVSLKSRFRVELHAHRQLFGELRDVLGKWSFIALWGRSLAVYSASEWALLGVSDTLRSDADAIILGLDPHLAVISKGFSLPRPSSPGQLELFPTRSVGDRPTTPENELSPAALPLDRRHASLA